MVDRVMNELLQTEIEDMRCVSDERHGELDGPGGNGASGGIGTEESGTSDDMGAGVPKGVSPAPPSEPCCCWHLYHPASVLSCTNE